jgi:hypothetical protein
MKLYFDGLSYKFNTSVTSSNRYVTLHLRVEDSAGRYVASTSEYLGVLSQGEDTLNRLAEGTKPLLLARMHPDRCALVAFVLEDKALNDARAEIETSLRCALRDIIGDMRNAGLLGDFRVRDIAVRIDSPRPNPPYTHTISVSSEDK